MPSLLQILKDILLLRRGPQDLPYSTQLLVYVAALCVIVQTVAGLLLTNDGIGQSAIAAALSVSLILFALNFALGLRGFRNRFVQTAAAWLACSLVFTLIGVPLALLIGEPPSSPAAMTPLTTLLGILVIPVVIWQVLVNANILRHGLGVSLGIGVAISVLWAIAITALVKLGGTPI